MSLGGVVMFGQDDFHQLVETAYEAARDPDRWPTFLQQLGHALEAPVLALFVQDLRSQAGQVAVSSGFDPQLQAEYQAYYAQRNVWMIRGRRLATRGHVRVSQASCPDDALVKTEFYNDYLRRLGVFHGVGGTVHRSGSLTANITALRPKAAGPFGDHALRLLAEIEPHLRCALDTHRRLAGLQLEQDAIFDVLDRVPFGLALVDRHAAPVFVNAEAMRILRLDDGLTIERQKLTAVRPRDTQRLRALIAEATVPSGGSGHLALARPSLGRPFGIEIAPLGRAGADMNRVAGVFISDPERNVSAENALVQLYAFTPTESAVATRLLGGDTVEEAAASLDMARETARTHLKRIYRKTGATGQADLVRRLMEGPGRLA
jgi:DNA-binding CsgD family transcriptional regulator